MRLPVAARQRSGTSFPRKMSNEESVKCSYGSQALKLLNHFVESFGCYFRSDPRPRIVNFDAQHWVSCQQFCRCLLGCTLFREVIFEVATYHHRVSGSGRDIRPLNISWLRFFYAESWFLHVALCAVRRVKCEDLSPPSYPSRTMSV